MNTKRQAVGLGTALGLALAVVTTTTAAMAFSRNISGAWTMPNGRNVLVAHDPSNGNVVFTMPGNLSAEINHLQFKGSVFGAKVLDGDSSANDFMFSGDMEPVSFGTKTTTCTVEGSIGGMGTVLGQVPSRKLRMGCRVNLSMKCEDGTKKNDDFDCSGDWK